MSVQSRSYSENFYMISRQNNDHFCFSIPVYQNHCLENHLSLEFSNYLIIFILY